MVETKIALHNLIDVAVDIHDGKSVVNFVHVNRVLHELVNHLGIADKEINIGDNNIGPPPKQTVSLPTVVSDTGSPRPVSALKDDKSSRAGSAKSSKRDRVQSATSNLSEQDNKTISDLKEKVSDLEKKISTMEDLVDDDTKVEHKESMIGDMFNFVNLGKRVDGCEESLQSHAKLIDGLRKEIKDLNAYKFYLDQLKETSPMDLTVMIEGLVSDMSEKTKKINALSEKLKTLEGSKPDEALAQELAKKVEGLMQLKDDIDGKLGALPTKADIDNIHELYVTWIGLDEILKAYKPPRSPVPPSREGVEALAKAGELDQKTHDLGDKLTGLEQEVKSKIDTEGLDQKIDEAIKQKRPPSSRTEMARTRFTEALQELQDRLNNLESRLLVSHPEPVTHPNNVVNHLISDDEEYRLEPLATGSLVPLSQPSDSETPTTQPQPHDFTTQPNDFTTQPQEFFIIPPIKKENMALMENFKDNTAYLRTSHENILAEFGGKALPNDLKEQLDALQAGMQEALNAAELIGEVSQENETNKAAISEVNGQIEDLLDRYKILQDTMENAPKPTADLDNEAVQALKDTIKALGEEQEAHHEHINRLNDDATQKDLHLKTLYSGVDDLREMKADKDFVVMEMEDKADKRSVDHKANRVFVDNHFDKLNSGLESALKRCEGQEEALKIAINQISSDVEGKLDRMELQNVKDFLESRLNKLNTAGPPAPPQNTEDPDPAGMRRRLLKFHCISCDRPVEVNSGGMLPSALPVAYGFPGMRSNRPYTTYELELIRQHQRNQNIPRYPWSDPYDMPPTNRSCGGQHTMTYAHRRTRISALSQFFKEDEPVPVPVPLRETEIQGQDGHIYRGRLQQRKFPVLPRVGQSAEKLPRLLSQAEKLPRILSPDGRRTVM